MKQIVDFIQEGLKINSKTKINSYKYHPKDKSELVKLIKQLLDERGEDANLNDIDVSKITDMSHLFHETNFNGDISKWDVSNVENMNCMFYNCEKFNSDLSEWNVSKVTDMYGMFYFCENFNSDLSKWDVSKVTDMYGMFYSCENFKSNLSKWNVSKNVDMRKMFVNSGIENNLPKWYINEE